MKKYIVPVLLCFALFPLFLPAQDNSTLNADKQQENYRFRDHLITGGFLGLQFGTEVYVNVAPFVGYKITDKLQAGVGASYTYERWRYAGYPDIIFSAYGGSVWGRYFFTDNLFAHAEYEVLNGAWDSNFPDHRYNITSVFLGGGYRQRFGRMSSYLLVLWNINDSMDSPYYNPVIRIGIAYGM